MKVVILIMLSLCAYNIAAPADVGPDVPPPPDFPMIDVPVAVNSLEDAAGGYSSPKHVEGMYLFITE